MVLLNKVFLYLTTMIFVGFWTLPSLAAGTNEIQFAQDELPSESITPVLDYPQAVQNRSLTFSRKFALSPLYGWMLDEPFYQNQYFGILAQYHLNDVNSIGLRFQSWSSGTSDYAKQFEASSANLRFDWAPGPKTATLLNYERNFMYGKISLAKGTVLPMSIYGIAQIGMTAYGSKSLPFLGVGIGQKFFLGKSWGLQLQLLEWLQQQLDPLSTNIRGDATPQPTETSFSSKFEPSAFMDLGLIYLF